MKSTKHLLAVLMDGIKDAGMWLEYSKEAESEDLQGRAEWFRDHAKKRIESLQSIYDYVESEIELDEKADAGDALACAFKDHICSQIKELKIRYENE